MKWFLLGFLIPPALAVLFLLAFVLVSAAIVLLDTLYDWSETVTVWWERRRG